MCEGWVGYHDDAMMQIPSPSCLAPLELLVQRGHQEQGPQRHSCKDKLEEDACRQACCGERIGQRQNDLTNLQARQAVLGKLLQELMLCLLDKGMHPVLSVIIVCIAQMCSCKLGWQKYVASQSDGVADVWQVGNMGYALCQNLAAVSGI